MTLNEKLELIAELENEKLEEEFITEVVELVENPEPIGKRFPNVEELIADLEKDNED